jgi:hypothetical protein
MHELLFSRQRTLTPGGHPGGGIVVTGRGDGLLVRVIDQEGSYTEVFLPTSDVNNLVEMLTENLDAWGWRPQ